MDDVVVDGNVRFNDVLILEVTQRVSKAGNPFSTLRFLDQKDLLVYDVMQFDADAVSRCQMLKQGERYRLEFFLMPGRDGGVRMVLQDVREPSTVV